jgi:hypothetical protein
MKGMIIMIDPMTTAIIATTLGSVNAGTSILQIKKQNEIKKEYRRMRIELGCFEGGVIAAIIAGMTDSLIMRKMIKADKERYNSDLDGVLYRIDELDRRINNLNLDALDAKLDMVVAATANPIIIPAEKPYTIHEETNEIEMPNDTKDTKDITEVNIDKAFLEK